MLPLPPAPSSTIHPGQDEDDVEQQQQQDNAAVAPSGGGGGGGPRRSRRRPLPSVSLQPLPSAFQPFEQQHRPKLRHLSPELVAVASTHSLVGGNGMQQQSALQQTSSPASTTSSPANIVRRSSSPIIQQQLLQNGGSGGGGGMGGNNARPVSRCCMCVEVHLEGGNTPRRGPTSSTSSCLALVLCLVLLLSIASVAFTVIVLNVQTQQHPGSRSMNDLLRAVLHRIRRGPGGIGGGTTTDFKQIQNGLPSDVKSRFDPITSMTDIWQDDVDITAALQNAQATLLESRTRQHQWSKSTLFSQWKCPGVALGPFGIDYPDMRGLFPDAGTLIFYGVAPAGDVNFFHTSCMQVPDCKTHLRNTALGALKEIVTEGYVRLSARAYLPVMDVVPVWPSLGVIPELVASIVATGASILHIDNVIVDSELAPCVRVFVQDKADDQQLLVLYCGLGVDGDLFAREGLSQSALRRFLRPFGQMAVLIRGSGYPLFADVATSDAVLLNHARAALLVSTSILVQDDSGLPFSIVHRHMDNVQVFGNYRGFVDPAAVPDLATASATVVKSLFQKDLALMVPTSPLPPNLTFGHRAVVGYKINNGEVVTEDALVKRSNWKGSHMVVAYGKSSPASSTSTTTSKSSGTG